MDKLIIISGATATGKTGLAIEIAKLIDGEIVNFDSLLFYKEINIGTAKPSQEEMDGIVHHMIDCTSIKNPLNAADYSRDALEVINDIHQRNKCPVLVGGSGFYLQALLNGMYDSETTSLEVQNRSDEQYEAKGIEPFLEILKSIDPVSFEHYHQNDHYRVRRAVEHYWMTNTPLSLARNEMKDKLAEAPKENWDIFHIYLNIPKDQHWEIIQNRTKKIMKAGLLMEVKDILDKDFDINLKPLKSIGYKETIAMIRGEYKDSIEYEERIFIATRRLAKSQKTWFNKILDKTEYNPLVDHDKILSDAQEHLVKQKNE